MSICFGQYNPFALGLLEHLDIPLSLTDRLARCELHEYTTDHEDRATLPWKMTDQVARILDDDEEYGMDEAKETDVDMMVTDVNG